MEHVCYLKHFPIHWHWRSPVLAKPLAHTYLSAQHRQHLESWGQKGCTGHLWLLWMPLGVLELAPGVPCQPQASGNPLGMGLDQRWDGQARQGLAVHCWPWQCLVIFLWSFPLSGLPFIQRTRKIWACKSLKFCSRKPAAISGCNNLKWQMPLVRRPVTL